MAIFNLDTGEQTDEQPQQAEAEVIDNSPKPGTIYNLDTGKPVNQEQGLDVTANQEGASFGDQFVDLFTGELRQTETIKDLPEVISLDLGNTFDNLKLRSSLVITPNAGEKIALIKNNFPDVKVSTDEKENVVLDFGNGKKAVLDAPGVSLAGVGETFAEIAAFIPAAIGVGKFTKSRTAQGLPTSTTQKAAIGGAGAGLTQTVIEGLQSQIGGTFDPEEIAIATALGGVAETVLPAIQSFRNSRRAKAIGAESEDVASAIESIRPITQAQQGLEQATGVNVPLFQAQQTQIPSELLKQRVLPQLDAGARAAAKALESQNKAAFDATSELINAIAPEGSVVSASQRFKDAAQKAIQIRKRARSEQASPIYKQAFRRERQGKNPPIKTSALQLKVSEMAKQFDQEDQIAKSLLKASKKIKSANGSIQKLHNAKIEIDQMIAGTASDSLGNTTKRFLTDVQTDLVGQMTKQSPSYRAARDEFIRLSPPIEDVVDSVIGKVSEFSNTKLKNVAQTIFDPKAGLTDPKSILNAKKLIDDVDPEAWDQLLRVEMNRRIGGLEQLIEDIPGDFVGNIPGQLRRTLFGNPPQRKALLSGMSEDQKKNFKYLETVLKRASSGRAAGSPTAPFGEAIEKLKGVSVVIRDAIFKPLSTLQQTGERGIFDRNVARLSEVMFNPNFKPELNRLRELDPNSPAAARALTQLLNVDSKTNEEK